MFIHAFIFALRVNIAFTLSKTSSSILSNNLAWPQYLDVHLKIKKSFFQPDQILSQFNLQVFGLCYHSPGQACD